MKNMPVGTDIQHSWIMKIHVYLAEPSVMHSCESVTYHFEEIYQELTANNEILANRNQNAEPTHNASYPYLELV